MGLYFVQVMLKKTSLPRRVDKVKYVPQEEFHWEEEIQDRIKVQEVWEAGISTLHHRRHHHPHQFHMLVQLQVQQHIHCSGHLCIPSRKQQEEETHQEVLQIKEVAAPVNGIIKGGIRQEEALDQEEALGQEEQDHLHHHLRQEGEGQHQEADQEEARRREELHPSRQEEEQVIQGLHHPHLQALYNLHAQQIHGVHSIDPGKPCRSLCYRPTTRHAAYWRWDSY